MPDEDYADKLALVLEPEAAAVYCQSMKPLQRAGYCSAPEPYTAAKYLVVDGGGGTVDIAAYRIHQKPIPHMEVIHEPAGGSWGGTEVNLEFQNYLGNLVGDKDFVQYLTASSDTENAKHETDLNEIIYTHFENQKIRFDDAKQSKVLIRLTDTFMKQYKTKLMEAQNFTERDIRIMCEIIKKFFDPVIEGILKCMKDVLKNVQDVSTIYLVGGFGGCPYVYKMVQDHFKGKYKFITPEEHMYAVVKGAAMMGKNPMFLNARCIDATYGVQVSIPFKDGMHEEMYRVTSADRKHSLCTNIFSTFVERGDIVNLKDVYVMTYTPERNDQEFMRVQLYSSSEKDVWYTTGKRPSHAENENTPRVDVQKIGELIIPFLNDKSYKNELEDRKVDVIFDFSTTEVKVKGYDTKSGTNVRVVLDFLEA